jgi:signal transduction histidine kinase
MQIRQEAGDIAFWMWFVILFVIGLVFLIIIITRLFYKNIFKKEQRLNASKLEHQKELLKTTILTQEKERNRIAQDIHDGLVSQLNVIRLSKKEDEKAINAKLKECIKTVRLISHDLMPPLIEKTPLEDLLTKLLVSLETSVEVTVYKMIQNTDTIEASIKLQIFRIVQEVTTNIIKHANASKVQCLLRITNKNIVLKIEDNGVGFKTAETAGLGLNNIIARTQLLNGIHKFKSIPNSKTTFLLMLNTE